MREGINGEEMLTYINEDGITEIVSPEQEFKDSLYLDDLEDVLDTSEACQERVYWDWRWFDRERLPKDLDVLGNLLPALRMEVANLIGNYDEAESLQALTDNEIDTRIELDFRSIGLVELLTNQDEYPLALRYANFFNKSFSEHSARWEICYDNLTRHIEKARHSLAFVPELRADKHLFSLIELKRGWEGLNDMCFDLEGLVSSDFDSDSDSDRIEKIVSDIEAKLRFLLQEYEDDQGDDDQESEALLRKNDIWIGLDATKIVVRDTIRDVYSRFLQQKDSLVEDYFTLYNEALANKDLRLVERYINNLLYVSCLGIREDLFERVNDELVPEEFKVLDTDLSMILAELIKTQQNLSKQRDIEDKMRFLVKNETVTMGNVDAVLKITAVCREFGLALPISKTLQVLNSGMDFINWEFHGSSMIADDESTAVSKPLLPKVRRAIEILTTEGNTTYEFDETSLTNAKGLIEKLIARKEHVAAVRLLQYFDERCSNVEDWKGFSDKIHDKYRYEELNDVVYRVPNEFDDYANKIIFAEKIARTALDVGSNEIAWKKQVQRILGDNFEEGESEEYYQSVLKDKVERHVEDLKEVRLVKLRELEERFTESIKDYKFTDAWQVAEEMVLWTYSRDCEVFNKLGIDFNEGEFVSAHELAIARLEKYEFLSSIQEKIDDVLITLIRNGDDGSAYVENLRLLCDEYELNYVVGFPEAESFLLGRIQLAINSYTRRLQNRLRDDRNGARSKLEELREYCKKEGLDSSLIDDVLQR